MGNTTTSLEADSVADLPLQYLPWDSNFFGKRIARVAVKKLTPAIMSHIERWRQENELDCLYYLAHAQDEAAHRLAQEHAFRFIDVRLTLERQLGDPQAGERAPLVERVRLAKAEDVPALRTIAGQSHRDSRFYADRRFTQARADALYEQWIANSVDDPAVVVLVPVVDDRAVGYITCHVASDAVGQIGLLGVAEEAQGLGIGSLLVRTALNWFERQPLRNVTVVTQGRNLRAQRLYQRAGFVTGSVEIWFHRWFTDS